MDDAVMGSSQAHENQMNQYLNKQEVREQLQRLILDMLLDRPA